MEDRLNHFMTLRRTRNPNSNMNHQRSNQDHPSMSNKHESSPKMMKSTDKNKQRLKYPIKKTDPIQVINRKKNFKKYFKKIPLSFENKNK